LRCSYGSGEPVVIPNSEGSRTTPSVVAFTKNNERLVDRWQKGRLLRILKELLFLLKGTWELTKE